MDPNLDLPEPRGWSMVFQHLASGDIHGNICAWNVTSSATNRTSYYFNGLRTGGMVGINQTDFWDNISYDWRAPILFDFNGVAFGQQGPAPGLWLDSNDIQEPNVSVEVIEAWNMPPGPPPVPTGLGSGNNRVHTILLPAPPFDTWCLWPGSMPFGPPQTANTWQNSVGDTNSTAGPPVTYSMQQSGWPPLPDPSISYPNPGNIEWFLGLCRQQSRQNWQPELLATNIVGRYATYFN